MQSNTSRIPALLVISLAGAFSLMAQRVAPEDGAGWAHPPIRVMPAGTRVSAGSSPSQMRTAYGVSQLTNQGEGQTIALIDAYDNPDAESDLATFSNRFSLPACTTANGCFKKIYATGSNTNWSPRKMIASYYSQCVEQLSVTA